MQLTSFKEITTSSRHIFLSPHFDDVVYSCGGTLAVQVSNGLRPLVITVFGGIPTQGVTVSPFAFGVQKGMGASNITPTALMENRRKEDAAALDFLNANYLWLDYLDAIYRGNPPYYTSNSQLIGGEVHPADIDIDQQLAQDLVELSDRLPDAVWYAPLGIGGHVDHQIVTSAIDRLIQRGATVKMYEDFPFVLREGTLEERMHTIGGAFEPAYVEMSEMLPLRLQASEMYSSQVQLNFHDRNHLRKTMEDYTHSIRSVQTVHLERYWIPG